MNVSDTSGPYRLVIRTSVEKVTTQDGTMVAAKGKFFCNLRTSSLLEIAFFGVNFNNKILFLKWISTGGGQDPEKYFFCGNFVFYFLPKVQV